jgi:hypothetical protein
MDVDVEVFAATPKKRDSVPADPDSSKRRKTKKKTIVESDEEMQVAPVVVAPIVAVEYVSYHACNWFVDTSPSP